MILKTFLLGLCIARIESARLSRGTIKAELKSEEGTVYNLNLKRADETVLHPNFKVINLEHDPETDQVLHETWTPSHEDLKTAEEIYIDEENLAVVRFVDNEIGGRSMHGTVDGKRVKRNSTGGHFLRKSRLNQNHSDYIEIDKPFYSFPIRNGPPTEAVVEVLLVCDKEFGDIFNHERGRILDYLTVYFWDINMRYKTLPSVKMSFRIVGVVLVSTPGGQPFIEQARASDGRAEFNRILDKFSHWVFENRATFPKFDMAVAITNTKLEWFGGLAYLGTTCVSNDHRNWGVVVFNDDGVWGSLDVAAHEMAHSLGAPHDDADNFPGGCSDRGYIMSGSEDYRWFFSTCSDRIITQYANSDRGACLRRIDAHGYPAMDPDFESALAPSMEAQCKRRLNDERATIEQKDEGNCQKMRCIKPVQGGWSIHWHQPVDNTPCMTEAHIGRCFRGRCRRRGGLLRNVGSGKCALADYPFDYRGILTMVDCPRTGTPMDKFTFAEEKHGILLATPWNSKDAKENGDKCIYTGNAEGNALATDRCSSDNPWHGWDLLDVGNREFLLQHRISKRCAKPAGNHIGSFGNCDRNDRNMRWRLD